MNPLKQARRPHAGRYTYEVNDGPPAVVRILAVGIKRRESLQIGGEEIKL